jgi:DNA-binding Xre family transcriptional regulator
MRVSYKKLWIMLIEKDLTKGDLRRMTKLSSSTIAKVGKGENVNIDVLVKICEVLDCDITEIMELVPDKTLKSEEEKT